MGAGGSSANGGASASGGRSVAGASASGGAGGAAADAGDGSAGDGSAGDGSGGTNTGGASEAGTGGSGGCTSRTTYFADTDADRFGDALSSVEACSRPPGHVENSDDCYDGNAAAKPGQTAWFPMDRGDGSYDYDCDGSGSQHWPEAGACGLGGVGICTLREGWQGAVPLCGGEAEYFLTCTGLAFCGSTTEKRTQDCH